RRAVGTPPRGRCRQPLLSSASFAAAFRGTLGARVTGVLACRIVLRPVAPAALAALAALAADPGHVLAVLAHRLAALAAGGPRLVGVEFVGGALAVGGTPPGAGDPALLLRVHGGKAPVGAAIGALVGGRLVGGARCL